MLLGLVMVADLTRGASGYRSPGAVSLSRPVVKELRHRRDGPGPRAHSWARQGLAPLASGGHARTSG